LPYTLFAPALYLQATPGASYNTSTTITDVSTNPQYVMPPNTITTVGQGLSFFGAGVYSTTSNQNLTLGIYKNTQTTAGGTGVGGAALGASTTIAAGTTQTNLPWFIELRGVFTAVGTSGSFLGYGVVMIALTTTTQTIQMIPFTTPQTAVTVDTTKPTILSVGATWGTNSASNIVICNVFQVQLLN
jgi:hypothetical protein